MGVGFAMCGCFVKCVHVFTVLCIVCTVSFMYIYSYLFLSVLVYGLLLPSDNSIAFYVYGSVHR